MKSANSGTPRSYLEVKGLHRLGDAVVGGRRHPITADALEEAHLSRPARRVARRSGGDRCASQGHAWGSPKAGGCQWRPSGRCFDASALATTRAAARHLLHGATRPLRRWRTSWMPTALGSVMGVSGKRPPPSHGRASRVARRAPRRERRARTRETRQAVSQGKHSARSASARRVKPYRNKQPRGVKGLHSHSTVNTKYHSSAPTPRQRRSPTHRREAASLNTKDDDLRRRHQEL